MLLWKSCYLLFHTQKSWLWKSTYTFTYVAQILFFFTEIYYFENHGNHIHIYSKNPYNQRQLWLMKLSTWSPIRSKVKTFPMRLDSVWHSTSSVLVEGHLLKVMFMECHARLYVHQGSLPDTMPEFSQWFLECSERVWKPMIWLLCIHFSRLIWQQSKYVKRLKTLP